MNTVPLTTILKAIQGTQPLGMKMSDGDYRLAFLQIRDRTLDNVAWGIGLMTGSVTTIISTSPKGLGDLSGHVDRKDLLRNSRVLARR